MRKLSLAFSTLFLFCSAAFALEVPEKPSSYVNDYVSLLSPGTRAGLEEKLAEFDRETSNQLVVAVFASLEGGSLEDFSIRLADRWKPGDEKKDNGVILLVFRDDRAVRIEVGYGLEGALPDAIAKRIIEDEIVPRFKQGDFDGGVAAAAEAIMLATRGEYQGGAAAEDPMDKYAPWAFLGLVLYMLLPWVCYFFIAAFCYAALGLPGLAVAAVIVGLLHMLRKALMSAGPTYSSRGGGWYSGGSGRGFGGGFGGFSGGGGGFGGGGASGRW